MTLAETVPLAKTMAEKVTAQRSWAVGRTRNASVPRVEETGSERVAGGG